MSDNYTPTTKEVETHWANVGFAGDRASFRRWLAAHDAEVAATERARIVKHLSSSSIVTVAGKGGALEWLRKTEPEGKK